MCGIVGYVGPSAAASTCSWAAFAVSSTAATTRPASRSSTTTAHRDRASAPASSAGARRRPRRQPAAPTGTPGIGHTRWATHGGPTDGNAHPHLGDDGRLALIHNGIIENFAELKDELLDDGRRPSTSETDTEVAALLARPRVPRRPATSARRSAARSCAPRRRLHAARHARRTSPASSSALAATRRSSSGSATARTSSARMSRRSSSTPQRASRSARTRSSRSRPDSVDGHRLRRATPVAAKPFEVAWDASAAEKGGWSELHEEGDQRGARCRREHPAAAAIIDGTVVTPRADAVADDADATSTASS